MSDRERDPARFIAQTLPASAKTAEHVMREAGLQSAQGAVDGNPREEHMRGNAIQLTRREVLASAALGALAGPPGLARAATPDGQLTWGVHISLAPVWFDPADISGIITPFMVLYALHDAIVKPMPEQALAPSLAPGRAPKTGSTTSSCCAKAPNSTMAIR
jgi:hypothetical protein